MKKRLYVVSRCIDKILKEKVFKIKDKNKKKKRIKK